MVWEQCVPVRSSGITLGGKNVSSPNYTCIDCINITYGSPLCVVMREQGPVPMRERTEPSGCYETGICRMLWACKGHPPPWKWLRAGFPEEVTFEMSSKEKQAFAYLELEGLGQWSVQSAHVWRYLGSRGTSVGHKNSVSACVCAHTCLSVRGRSRV